MNRINRSQAGILAVVVLLLIIISSSLLGSFGGYGGMMEPGMMGGWGFASFGWLGMIFMWLLPLSFVALLVVAPPRLIGSTALPVSRNWCKL